MSELEDTIEQEKRRMNKNIDEDEEEDETDCDLDDSEIQNELMESAVDALYSSNGRTLTDVWDYHLNKIAKILLQMQKQQLQIARSQ